MSNSITPEIEAEISLLSSANGGRVSALKQGEYRGVLCLGAGNFSVRFLVVPERGVAPGESGVFGIQFLFPEIALPHFSKGACFTVWEGRIVGHGQVLKVLTPS